MVSTRILKKKIEKETYSPSGLEEEDDDEDADDVGNPDGDDGDGGAEGASLSGGVLLKMFSVAPVCRVLISWVMFHAGSVSTAFSRRMPLFTRALETKEKPFFI